jgi:hypothetical protein
MADLTQIEGLAERRRRLLAESEALRRQIAGHVANLQPAAAWVETGYSAFRSLRALTPVMALVGGFFVARKGTGLLRVITRLWSGLRLVRQLPALWRRFK